MIREAFRFWTERLRPAERESGAASEITVVLTNWKRQKNMKHIIAALRNQTTKPVLFLWNNNPTKKQLAVDWQVDSSKNKLCWPRWFMASMADTEFVAIHDDDLLLTDDRVLHDAITYLRTLPTGTIIGVTGKRFVRGRLYKECGSSVSEAADDQEMDMIKGRLMILRTADLESVRLETSPSRDVLMCDDMVVSASLAGPHFLPSLFAKRWKNLPEPNALHHLPDHFTLREKARTRWFPDS